MIGRGKPHASPATGAPGRPYAISSAELKPGGERAKDSSGWQWIILAALGMTAMLAYTRVWPALQELLYEPSPLRNYLLPPSQRPLTVIAGVGVGWNWAAFVAAPGGAGAAAGLWWVLLAWSNHQARIGALGNLRPGQQWPGERYPAGPLTLGATAVVLGAVGALLRWAAPAAATLVGALLLVAVLAALGWLLIQFVQWACARAVITRQINQVTFLASPALGWPDLRAGRVRVMRCAYPRGDKPFPKRVKLFYAQHPRAVGDELAAEVAAVLHQVTGRTYTVEHDLLTRTLIGNQSEVIEQDTEEMNAENVLAPLVASWFDPAACIAALTVTKPLAVDEDSARTDGANDDAMAGARQQSIADAIAERIDGFTVEFAYNVRVSSPYRRGLIEGMVCDALGGSWEADWSMVSRRVRFVRCPGLPTLVDPPLDFPTVTRASIRTLYKSAVIPFAVDAYGNTVGWDFRQSPHMLIAGATSSGKTSLLMTVATQCARRGLNVVWIDPKGFDSPGMRDYPNVSLVTAGTDDDGLVGHTAVLRFIADTMRERLAKVKVNPNRADDFDPIIVITDEFSNLVVALAEFYSTYRTTKEKGAPPTTVDVGVLLRTARAVGIHMAIGIQRPDVMYVAGEARDNTALRVAMGRLRSKDAAIMMFNNPVAGTRLQPGIKGRGTVQLPDGSFREIQAFYTPKVPATDEQRAALSDNERKILRKLAEVDSFWPRRVVDSALRHYDPDDPEQHISFARIRDSEIVLACERPDLDPLSDQYVMPVDTVRRPTMDDAHDDPEGSGGEAGTTRPELAAGGGFGGNVDGFDDDYLPDIDDEYDPPVAVPANELTHGDLVCVDGVSDWKYVHAEPYLSDDAAGDERLVIPYRDLTDGQHAGDVDVDPHEVVQARRFRMN